MTAFLFVLAAVASHCGEKPNQTAMTMCEKVVADAADSELNRVWARARSAMQAKDRTAAAQGDPSAAGYATALLASQRAWLAYRDAECRIESYEWRGGSMQAFTENQCMAALTGARTRQLKGMLAWDSER